MIKRIAFTLAEVLITLGIIGIVAEMTIPTLMNNVADQQFKGGLKKNFSVFSQATLSILNDNGGSMVGLCTSGDCDCLRDKYAEYLTNVKTCDNGTSGCFYAWGERWKYLSGALITAWGADSGSVLRDGSVINYGWWDSTCAVSCGNIYLDVNGTSKNPNTIGKDIFLFNIVKTGIVPYGMPGDGTDCVSTTRGQGCAYKYLYGN